MPPVLLAAHSWSVVEADAGADDQAPAAHVLDADVAAGTTAAIMLVSAVAATHCVSQRLLEQIKVHTRGSPGVLHIRPTIVVVLGSLGLHRWGHLDCTHELILVQVPPAVSVTVGDAGVSVNCLHGVLLVAIVLLCAKGTLLSTVLFVLVDLLQKPASFTRCAAISRQAFEVRQRHLTHLGLVLRRQRLAHQRLHCIAELHQDERVCVLYGLLHSCSLLRYVIITARNAAVNDYMKLYSLASNTLLSFFCTSSFVTSYVSDALA